MTLTIGVPADIPLNAHNPRRIGSQNQKFLLLGKENTPWNYSFRYSWGKEGNSWGTPRHRHTFDQIRWEIKGDYSLTEEETMPEGWVGFFPESVFYGPQAKDDGVVQLTAQFAGVNGQYVSRRQNIEIQEKLIAEGGSFEGGMYVWHDENGERHQKESGQACDEYFFGRKIEYSTPRYRNYILMNPEAFAWRKHPDLAGVGRRFLGSYTERDVRIEFLQLDPGSQMPYGTHPSVELLYVVEGSITCQDQTYGPQTALGTEAETAPEMITANEDTLLYHLKLPTL